MDWKISRPALWALLGFAVSLFLAPLGEVHKWFGMAGAVAYLIGSVILLVVAHQYLHGLFISRVSERQAVVMAAVTFVALIILFAVMYPIADARPGGGSDADDALDIAVTEIFHGRAPYQSVTQFGNPTGRLPGSLLMAAPFVALGESAYMGVFWLIVFFLAARQYLQNGRSALLLLWWIIILNPICLLFLITGNDRMTNTLYILVALMLLVTQIPKLEASTRNKILVCALFGVTLVTRGNFILILPIVFSYLVQNAGWKPALSYSALTGVVMILITIPLYAMDPEGFIVTFLSQTKKIGIYDPVLANATLVIMVLSGASALALMFNRMPKGSQGHAILLRNCAITQAIPSAAFVILELLLDLPFNYYIIGYAMHFMFFGACAAWIWLMNETRTPDPVQYDAPV